MPVETVKWPSPPLTTYTVADIVARTGAKERSVLLWADALALHAEKSTDRMGRGVHRKFDWREVEVAAVLTALAPYRLPTGVVARIGEVVRRGLGLNLNLPDDDPEWFRPVARREGVWLFLTPNMNQDDEMFSMELGTAPPAAATTVIAVNLSACLRGLTL